MKPFTFKEPSFRRDSSAVVTDRPAGAEYPVAGNDHCERVLTHGGSHGPERFRSTGERREFAVTDCAPERNGLERGEHVAAKPAPFCPIECHGEMLSLTGEELGELNGCLLEMHRRHR